MRYSQCSQLLNTSWNYVIIFKQGQDGLDQIDSFRTTLRSAIDVAQEVQRRYPRSLILDTAKTESHAFHVIVS